jgi:hypothetical protein
MDYVQQKERVACNQVPQDCWLSHTDGQLTGTKWHRQTLVT